METNGKNLNKSVERTLELNYKKWLFPNDIIDAFSSLQESHLFVVIGQGETGEKFTKLHQYSQNILDAGFCLPQQFVLTQEVLERMLFINGLSEGFMECTGYDERRERLVGGKVDNKLQLVLDEISSRLDSKALIVRSSALGDAAGTGIYTSVPVNNTGDSLARGIKEVLASYYTEEAELFREQSGQDLGYGIMISPLLGDHSIERRGSHTYEYISPLVSGHGYTNSPKFGPNIVLVPGIGGGVDDDRGEKIIKSDIEKNSIDTIEQYQHFRHKCDHVYAQVERKSRILGYPSGMSSNYLDVLKGKYKCKMYSPGDQKIVPYGTVNMDDIFRTDIGAISLQDLFTRLEALDPEKKSPKYVEWVKTKEGFGLVQIDDINNSYAHVDYMSDGELVLATRGVCGHGVREIDTIVELFSHEGLYELYQFNKEHTGYGLVYPSVLLRKRGGSHISFSDLSNASVIMEWQSSGRTGSALGHYGGQLEKANKYFGAIDTHHPVYDNNAALYREDQHVHEKYPHLKITKGNFVAVANQLQDIMLLYKEDID